MQITVIGAGPAGLYAAILLRRARPDTEITVFEQNAATATFGFGVVFSDQALDFLRSDDPETADLIEPEMKRWSDIHINHRDQSIAIDGVGFAAIGRLELLELLRMRAAELRIKPRYDTRVEDLDELPNSDLLIGADGLNSVVRNATPDAFGARVQMLKNRFAWYGANREFDALTQTFVETRFGRMNAHHYAYGPGRSTFIIEMGADTFDRTGFADLEEPDYRVVCEDIFSNQLRGAQLIPNSTDWRCFPILTCQTWHHGNRVLVGDALHTAHFSIGSGTRLALEDVVALIKVLQAENWQVAPALARYQFERKPILEKITSAARNSASWYENFPAKMDLEPWQFALSYVRRGGRLPPERLARLAPRFTAQLEARGIDLGAAA